MGYKSDARGVRPVGLVVGHTAEGSRTAASLGAYFWLNTTQASSHVGIDASNTLQYVDYNRSAWTLRSGNPISDNAEMCAFARWTREQWLSTGTVDGCVNPRAILDRFADWVRSRCLARGIPIQKVSPAQVAAGARGVIGHWEWTIGMRDGTHTDPGQGFPWDYVINRANNAGGGSTPPARRAINMEDFSMINTYPEGTWEIVGYRTDDEPDSETYGAAVPIKKLVTKMYNFVCPVGSNSSVNKNAWLNLTCAGAGVEIESARLMSIRQAENYGMDGGGYPRTLDFSHVKADSQRAAIQAADGQTSFTAFVKCAGPFSIGIEIQPW